MFKFQHYSNTSTIGTKANKCCSDYIHITNKHTLALICELEATKAHTKSVHDLAARCRIRGKCTSLDLLLIF